MNDERSNLPAENPKGYFSLPEYLWFEIKHIIDNWDDYDETEQMGAWSTLAGNSAVLEQGLELWDEDNDCPDFDALKRLYYNRR